MDKSKQYIVRRGQFDFSFDFGVHFGTTRESYTVQFDESCWYEPIDKENDWNKLAGWSYGLLPVKREPHFSASADFVRNGVEYVWAHHYNSIRIVWRPYYAQKKQDWVGTPIIEKGFEVCTYVYENGVRRVSEAPMKLGLEAELQLRYDGKYVYTTSGARYTWPLQYSIKPKRGYRLYPTFGGSNPAPHDMSLRLKRD